MADDEGHSVRPKDAKRGDDAGDATSGHKRSPDEEVAQFVTALVATGYDTRDQILESVTSYCEGFTDAERPSDAFIIATIDRAIDAQLEAQMTWPPTTDCDRLDLAFEELNERGILALQHFACCQTCGFAEMDEEVAYAREQGHAARGFVFFHWQDSEAATEGQGLHLSYAVITEGDPAQITRETIKMMDEVAGALQRHGLKTSWERRLNQRMHVALDWKRRFPVVLQ